MIGGLRGCRERYRPHIQPKGKTYSATYRPKGVSLNLDGGGSISSLRVNVGVRQKFNVAPSSGRGTHIGSIHFLDTIPNCLGRRRPVARSCAGPRSARPEQRSALRETAMRKLIVVALLSATACGQGRDTQMENASAKVSNVSS